MKKRFLEGYETYDTSNGYGNPDQWRSAFQQRMNKQTAASFFKNKAEDPHTILGVLVDADPITIKAAFRNLIMQWHPDRNAHRIDEATEMTQKIIAAYSLLVE